MAQKRTSRVDPSSIFATAMENFDEPPLVGSNAQPSADSPPPTPAKKTPTKKSPPAAKAPESPAKTKAAAPAPQSKKNGWTRVGMRVTPELAQQVAEYKRHLDEGVTYGQLATWACEDHPQEVKAMTEQVIAENKPAEPQAARKVSRVPRGHTGPTKTTGQLNPTFRPEEFEVIEDIQRQVQYGDETVPRTWVITAALRVAIRH